MTIPVVKAFEVRAPIADVWDLLTDPYRVVKCLPGGEILDRLDDQTYSGKLTVNVGPIPASFKGELRFERKDADSWHAVMVGSGTQLGGTSKAELRMSYQLAEGGDGTTSVSVNADVSVTGILAQFGQGIILQISDYLFEKFTKSVIAALDQPV